MTYQIERWADVWQEMEPHWQAHWREVAMHQAQIKLNVDVQGYSTLEAQGMLHLVTVRHDGVLIGYHLSIVRPHLHYQDTLHAYVDVYYVAPAHRKSLASVGARLFQYAETTLRQRGVKKVLSGTKMMKDMARLFEAQGWTETERLFTKYLGEE